VREHVGLVRAREPLDRGAVESDALVERTLDLGRGERHRLQGAHHIREPQADELDAALLDRAEYEVSLLVHGGPFMEAEVAVSRLPSWHSDRMRAAGGDTLAP
jgi:hypothetical protein